MLQMQLHDACLTDSRAAKFQHEAEIISEAKQTAINFNILFLNAQDLSFGCWEVVTLESESSVSHHQPRL